MYLFNMVLYTFKSLLDQIIMVKGQDLQILGIVAKLAHNDVNKEVETDIIVLSELPK